jgi:S-methylmethionine-dependent homocysteine/selenocysteine methylase
MNFDTCFKTSKVILMEGALGERLKREYNIIFDEYVAMAGLVYSVDSKQAMQTIFQQYLTIAENHDLPFIATTPTRRANKERVMRSNFDRKIIEDNVHFLQQMKKNANTNMYVGGLMGCKGDAYSANEILSIEEACEFHWWQANLFKDAGVDFLYAGIMPALSEAIGMAKAMERTGLPYIISFMIRDNGKLIDGTSIHNAILSIDNETIQKPICYMTNCIHPNILIKALSFSFNKTELVKERFCGIQANTSSLSPEELDNCCDLKASDSVAYADAMMDLYKYINPKIFGGCCGTDNTNMEEVANRLNRKFY